MVAIKDYHIEYLRWIKKAVADLDVAQELNHIKDNDAAIEDAFIVTYHLALADSGVSLVQVQTG